MELEEQLREKLRPYGEKVRAGTPDDLDYLPAVLYQLVEGQARAKEAAERGAVGARLAETKLAQAQQQHDRSTEQIRENLSRAIADANQEQTKRADEILAKLAETSTDAKNAQVASRSELEKGLALLNNTLVALVNARFDGTIDRIDQAVALLQSTAADTKAELDSIRSTAQAFERHQKLQTGLLAAALAVAVVALVAAFVVK